MSQAVNFIQFYDRDYRLISWEKLQDLLKEKAQNINESNKVLKYLMTSE